MPDPDLEMVVVVGGGGPVSQKNFFRPFGPQFVYVIGLHAVQFGNNWMKKLSRTAKIG